MPLGTTILAAALQVTVPGMPSSQALALGRKLAEQNIYVATILPMSMDAEIAELTTDEKAKSLTPKERADLQATGRRLTARIKENVISGMAMSYAKDLPLSDLKKLVAAAGRPEAARLRAMEPRMVALWAWLLGPRNLKVQAAAEYCAQTRLMCGWSEPKKTD